MPWLPHLTSLGRVIRVTRLQLLLYMQNSRVSISSCDVDSLGMDGIHSLSILKKKIFLAYLTCLFIHASQRNWATGAFPPKYPMIDLHDNIFCPTKLLPRNSSVITLIYLSMSLYTSNIISILSLLVPSFKADAKIISVR